MASAIPSHHDALVIAEKGASHSLVTRVTPQPGPGQVLVEVKAIALNLVDSFQRDTGAFITNYPTVLGSDIAGFLVAIGPDVDSSFQLGSRVAAYASGYFHESNADYGSFQQFVLVAAEKVVPLPDSTTFNEGAILPMSVSVALSGWLIIGVDGRNVKYSPDDRQGVLVWGASTGVGSAAVQAAKVMGFRVYATASPDRHEYLERLGADRVFDYKSANVVSEIVNAVKEDDVTMHNCFLGQGDLATVSSVLSAVRKDDKVTAKIASAPIVPPDANKTVGDNVEVTFVVTPADPKEAYDYFHWAFNEWLKEKLVTGEFVPSPRVKVVGKGLADIDKSLDELKQGVRATKLVIEL